MLAKSPDFLRFKLEWRKCVEGIDVIARAIPGVTQYYVGKIFYYADKEHFLDWGRPISGDRYIAMPHGPVPSNVYDYLKEDSGEPDEILDELSARVTIASDGNKRRVFSRQRNDLPNLSGTDVEYLTKAAHKYGHMSFGELKALSHKEPAYVEAETQFGLNNEMNLLRWAEGVETNDGHLAERILNCQALLVRSHSKSGT